MIKVKVKWLLKDGKVEEKTFTTSKLYNDFMSDYYDEVLVSDKQISYIEDGEEKWKSLPDCNKCGDYEYCAFNYDECTGFY